MFCSNDKETQRKLEKVVYNGANVLNQKVCFNGSHQCNQKTGEFQI